jgi:hypothetical protein
MITREPNSLEGGVGYCEICKIWGHHPTSYPLLYKYQSTPSNLFYNFCKLVGHNEKDCHTFELIESALWMCTNSRKKISQQKEEFHSTTIQEALIRVDMEVSTKFKDMEDLVKEVDDR